MQKYLPKINFKKYLEDAIIFWILFKSVLYNAAQV